MRVRNGLLFVIGILLNLLFESVLLPHMDVFGLRPDTVIIVTVAVGVSLGSLFGALYGMMAGLLIDLLYAPYMGFYALAYMIGGYLAGLFNHQYFSQNLLIPPLFALLLVFLKEGLIYLQLRILGLQYDLGGTIVRYFLPSALLTAALTLPFFAIMRNRWRREWRRARWETIREEASTLSKRG